MARRITDVDGTAWEVAPSGRHTQYGIDELSLEFRRVGAEAERRYIRFSPRGAKSAEQAMEEVSDRALLGLLAASQPSWTSPDGSYAGGR